VQIRQLADSSPVPISANPRTPRLRATADAQIVPPVAPRHHSAEHHLAGAADGSEMGAFARDKNPNSRAGPALKLQEFMPAT